MEVCYLHGMTSTYLWNPAARRWQTGNSIKSDDRGLSYGDGLFETLRLKPDGTCPLWHWHRQRLVQGLVALDFPINALALIDEAIEQAPRQGTAAKLVITRGTGPRGYLPPAEPQLTVIWQLFTAPDWAHNRCPEGFDCQFSDIRLSQQPLLAGIKHLNRLEQVLCRQRMPESHQEAIMLDQEDWVIEGCMSNIFLLEGQKIITPDLTRCGVNGVIRRWLINQTSVTEASVSAERLLKSDAVLMTNSLNGVIHVRSVGSRRYDHNPEIRELQRSLQELFV